MTLTVTQLAQAFDFAFGDVANGRVPVYTWEPSFRASGLPFCQLSFLFFTWSKSLNLDIPPKHDSFLKDYFTSIGDVVHKVTQKWMGRKGILYGDWECPKCSSIFRSLGIVVCPSCNCECTYKEFDLSDGTPFKSVHPDGLISIKNVPGYILMDIKTTSLAKIPKKRFTESYHLNYLMQTAIYDHLLRLPPWNFDIVATLFLLIPRDKPLAYKSIVYKQTNSSVIYTNAVNSYHNALKSLETKNISDISGICVDRSSVSDCPWVDICFSRHRDKLIQEWHTLWTEENSKSVRR